MIIKNAKVLDENFKFIQTDIAVENGKFVSIGKSKAEADTDMIGKYIVPGLIDIHVHGVLGARFEDADENSVVKVLNYLIKQGVTSCALTLASMKHDLTLKAIESCKKYISDGEAYAKIAGIHMEGPYFSVKKKGGMKLL